MKILGYDYLITFCGDKMLDVPAGRVHAGLQRIILAEGDHPQQSESTLLHEIIEALDFHLEIGLDERQIKAIEAGLYQCLTENGVDLSPLLQCACKSEDDLSLRIPVDEADHAHCWHSTDKVLTAYPPLYEEKCCWCGETCQVMKSLPVVGGGLHGGHVAFSGGITAAYRPDLMRK